MDAILRPSKLRLLREELNALVGKYGQDLLAQAINDSIPDYKATHEELPEIEVSLEEAIEHFQSSSVFISLSSATKVSYKSELNQYRRHVQKLNNGNLLFKDATEPIVFLEYLEPYKSSNTYAKKCAFLRTFFKTVLIHFFGKRIDDIKDLLPVEFNSNKIPKSFKKTQLAEILALAQGTNLGNRNYAIVWTFLSTGIRLSELRQLQIKDILFDSETIMVKAKRKPRRPGPEKVRRTISKLGLIILQDFIEFKYNYKLLTNKTDHYGDLFIFSKDNGKTPLSGRAIEYIIDDLIVRAESIKEEDKSIFTTHSFRHTFAMYGLESGLDIYTISRLLGHSSIRTTSIYLNLSDEQLQNAINKHQLAKEEMLKMEERLNSI
jgi:integrase/recombinase XerD